MYATAGAAARGVRQGAAPGGRVVYVYVACTMFLGGARGPRLADGPGDVSAASTVWRLCSMVLPCYKIYNSRCYTQ